MSVLVVLSGHVLPKLDVFKLKANKAPAASNNHGVDRFISSFKVQSDVFPDEFDSLLDSAVADDPLVHRRCVAESFPSPRRSGASQSNETFSTPLRRCRTTTCRSNRSLPVEWRAPCPRAM